jgi:hypothetical protein
MAPCVVPSATDDDSHLRHARTAEESGRLVSHSWHSVVGRELLPESNFFCIPTSVLTVVTTMDFLLCCSNSGVRTLGAEHLVCRVAISTCKLQLFQILEVDLHSMISCGHVWDLEIHESLSEKRKQG